MRGQLREGLQECDIQGKDQEHPVGCRVIIIIIIIIIGVYGEMKDVSKFRPFGCRAWMYLKKDRREKGKTAPRAVEVVNLGFASDLNTSALCEGHWSDTYLQSAGVR